MKYTLCQPSLDGVIQVVGAVSVHCFQKTEGNATVGNDIRLYDCKKCVVHASDESKVVVQGLDGYIVAEKRGQLLV